MFSRYLNSWLDLLKDKGNFKIYDVKNWEKQLQYTYSPISQKVKTIIPKKFGQLIECNMRTTYFENHTQNLMEKLFSDPFLKNKN